jgi:23S rRNA (guanine2445-N2)-methyltransferase / 23S rRNA (guanine2069-N7)-methyltransferase
MVKIRSRRKKKDPLQFVATCGAGLEKLVKEEIIALGGMDPGTTPGAVSWQASNLNSAYRACLWSRFSSRILVQLAQFEAADPETLYNEAGKIDWSTHFSGDTTFAVYCTLVKSEIGHSHYASLKIKDAVVDQFRKRTGQRPDVDVRKPGIRINLHVEGTTATLALDLSGDSLHRRGYRAGAGEAPLKETLAAAIVHLAGIRQDMPVDSCLLDPMCGSGTLLIEAALILGDSAPGLLREDFGFMYWNRHNQKLWDKLKEEAIEREDIRAEVPWPPIIGYDADPMVVAAARKNIVNAGLKERIVVKQRQLARLHPPAAKGIMISNPPYGERLSEKESVKYLYRCMGRIFKQQFSGWQLGFFTANPDLADMLGVSWQERYRLYNGPIKCRLLTAVAPDATEETARQHHWQLQETGKDLPAEDFCNRLRKDCQNLLPWAEKNKISCLRIYDADMPEYNLAIDLYEQWVHVQEYAPPGTVDRDKAKKRFNDALQVIRTLLNVPHSNLFIKTRHNQRDKQAIKHTRSGKLYEVFENNCRFLVNFTDFQDTGLFLDQRNIRHLLAQLCDGRTFCNLFASAGSATVCAALGGATSTVNVDIADRHLTRAKANLALNGFGGPLHTFRAQDCMQWLKSGRTRYGVIYMDPPVSFSVKKKNLNFDLQQDHEQLLRLAMDRLSRDGVLIFASNAKKFSFAPTLEDDFHIEDITGETVSKDFKHSRNIHRCWRIMHRTESDEVK